MYQMGSPRRYQACTQMGALLGPTILGPLGASHLGHPSRWLSDPPPSEPTAASSGSSTSPLGGGGLTSSFCQPPSFPSGKGLSLLLINIHPLPQSTGDRLGTMRAPPAIPVKKNTKYALRQNIGPCAGAPLSLCIVFVCQGLWGCPHIACCVQARHPCQQPPLSLSQNNTKYTLRQHIGPCAGAPRSLCIAVSQGWWGCPHVLWRARACSLARAHVLWRMFSKTNAKCLRVCIPYTTMATPPPCRIGF